MIKFPKAEIEESTKLMLFLSVAKCFYIFKHRFLGLIFNLLFILIDKFSIHGLKNTSATVLSSYSVCHSYFGSYFFLLMQINNLIKHSL